MSRESEKTAATKEKIKEAFLELYKKKRIEKISIQELTDLAGMNRGTFYAHYMDIYDLLNQIEDEYILTAQSAVQGILCSLLRSQGREIALPSEEFFEKNGSVMKLLLAEKPNPVFIARLKEAALRYVSEYLGVDYDNRSWQEVYAMEYIASAQLGIITYWIKNDRDVETEQLGEMVKRFSFEGPIRTLLAYSSQA